MWQPPEGHNRYEWAERQYQTIREYIKHEDGLIHQRTTHLVSVQTFLLGGMFLPRLIDILAAPKDHQQAGQLMKDLSQVDYPFFLAILVVIGLLTSLASAHSIRAASRSIDNLRRRWRLILAENPWIDYLPDVTEGGFPACKGADECHRRWRAWVTDMALPVSFFIIWIVVPLRFLHVQLTVGPL
jgi:hypothetical protein